MTRAATICRPRRRSMRLRRGIHALGDGRRCGRGSAAVGAAGVGELRSASSSTSCLQMFSQVPCSRTAGKPPGWKYVTNGSSSTQARHLSPETYSISIRAPTGGKVRGKKPDLISSRIRTRRSGSFMVGPLGLPYQHGSREFLPQGLSSRPGGAQAVAARATDVGDGLRLASRARQERPASLTACPRRIEPRA